MDANGAYSRKQALEQAERFAESGVNWFEEPVSSDDLAGLRLLRDRAPAGMNIAAGEYGYDAYYFRRMLAAGAVDVLQADATRCCGVSGFLQAAALCEAFELPFSFHCAPALHAALACAVPAFWVGEYFFDHARIETMLFEGAAQPIGRGLDARSFSTRLGPRIQTRRRRTLRCLKMTRHPLQHHGFFASERHLNASSNKKISLGHGGSPRQDVGQSLARNAGG